MRKVPTSIRALALVLGAMGSNAINGADIDRRTAMVCVFDEAKSLVLSGAESDKHPGKNKPDEIRSRFGRWLLSGNRDHGSSRIRFLWIPDADTGPELKVHASHTRHVLVQVRSQGPNSLVAVSSASDPFSVAGWLFSINFDLEQVLAAAVTSNPAGLESRAVKLSCSFNDKTPSVDPPAAGNSVG